MLARSIRLVRGGSTIEWKTFASGLIRSTRRELLNGGARGQCAEKIKLSGAERIRIQREERCGLHRPTRPFYNLKILLCKNQESKCQDPRDQAFGLHSLADNCCKAAVPVQYDISLPELAYKICHHNHLVHSKRHLESFHVAQSREVYRALWSNPSSRDERVSNIVFSWEAERGLKTSANLRGQIKFVSPRMGDINRLQGNGLLASDFELEKYDVILTQLQYILKERHGKHIQYNLDDVSRVRMLHTTEFAHIKSAADCGYPERSYLDTILQPKPAKPVEMLEEVGGGVLMAEKTRVPTADLLKTFILDICKALGGNASRLCIFAEEHGMIGIAPDGVQCGDYICQFQRTDVVGIARQQGPLTQAEKSFKILGRAVSILPNDGRWGEPFRAQSPLKPELESLPAETPAVTRPDLIEFALYGEVFHLFSS